MHHESVVSNCSEHKAKLRLHNFGLKDATMNVDAHVVELLFFHGPLILSIAKVLILPYNLGKIANQRSMHTTTYLIYAIAMEESDYIRKFHSLAFCPIMDCTARHLTWY